MQGGVAKVTSSSSDRPAMTSGTNSQSDGSEPPTASADDNNNTSTMSPTGGGAAGVGLIVSIDGESDGTNTPQVLIRGPPKHDAQQQHAGPRHGSLPDVMRLLPPIRDHDPDSTVQQGRAAGAGSVYPRSTRSSSPLLVLDRGGGPGLCFRALDSEKLLPMLLSAEAGLQRPYGLLRSHGNHGGSSSSGLDRPLSPRPPSPSLPHHTPKDKTAGGPHHLHLQRRFGEDKQGVSLDVGLFGRTVDGGPLNDITDIHPSMLRRRSCQSPNRLVFSERRRASEGILTIPPSQLGLYPKTKTKLEPRAQQQKAPPSRGRKEVGELMTAAPGRKPKGQKMSHGPGLTRLSRLNSASLETVNRHDDADDDDQERQRIFRWLEGVSRGSDGSADNEDSGVGELNPLSPDTAETAIRVIHKDGH